MAWACPVCGGPAAIRSGGQAVREECADPLCYSNVAADRADVEDAPAQRVDAPVLVMHVSRGNLAVVLPVNAMAAASLPARDFAALAAGAMIDACERQPGRADKPVLRGERRYALRKRGQDGPMDPDVALLTQTEGHWRIEDLPIQGQGASTARLPVGAFDLIDVDRPTLILHAGRPHAPGTIQRAGNRAERRGRKPRPAR